MRINLQLRLSRWWICRYVCNFSAATAKRELSSLTSRSTISIFEQSPNECVSKRFGLVSLYPPFDHELTTKDVSISGFSSLRRNRNKFVLIFKAERHLKTRRVEKVLFNELWLVPLILF
jgi:hypothetical protein